MKVIQIHNKKSNDKSWIQDVLNAHWGSSIIVSAGKITNAMEIPGFVATIEEKPVGFLSYDINNNDLEIITLNSEIEQSGIGAQLIRHVLNEAKDRKCRRVWCVTTNDNLPAIRFYQHRGFVLKTIHKNAVELSRKLKPGIPLIGIGGVPITEEWEFEFSFEL